jgi:hypothetical protein
MFSIVDVPTIAAVLNWEYGCKGNNSDMSRFSFENQSGVFLHIYDNKIFNRDDDCETGVRAIRNVVPNVSHRLRIR